jgi:hypothetical protein
MHASRFNVLLGDLCLCSSRYLAVAINSSKKSPEVIQLLDMHTHFSSATPGMKVCFVGHAMNFITCISLSHSS